MTFTKRSSLVVKLEARYAAYGWAIWSSSAVANARASERAGPYERRSPRAGLVVPKTESSEN
jgi:hypothetical protein